MRKRVMPVILSIILSICRSVWDFENSPLNGYCLEVNQKCSIFSCMRESKKLYSRIVAHMAMPNISLPYGSRELQQCVARTVLLSVTCISSFVLFLRYPIDLA